MIATMVEANGGRDIGGGIPDVGGKRNPRSYHFDYQPITDEVSRVRTIFRVKGFEEDLKLVNEDREWKELLKNVSQGAEVVFAVDDDTKEDLGVLVHRRKTVTLEGKSLTLDMIALRVVHEHARRLGIARGFTLDTVRRSDEQEEELDGFSGRTPNPLILKGYRHTPGTGLILPIDKLYTPQMREFMIAFLFPDIEEIRFRTGRCIGVYPPGENRLFTLDPTDEEGWAIRNKIVEPESKGGLGIDLEAGDGVRYVVFRKRTPKGRTRWETLPLGLNVATS